VLVVDKPAGMTSHDVVARVRRLAGTRKVGHAGTLDPMATGVLVVGVERATRLLGHLTLTVKAYDATIRLGESTSTDDAEGETLTTASARDVTDDQVRTAARAFVGDIEQRPAAVSAVKIDGRRAYARVRAGDLGESLAVGGHLTALRRTAVGPFGLADAEPLADLEPEAAMLDLAEVARRCFPVRLLDAEQQQAVGFGRPLDLDLAETGPVAVLAEDGRFLALYEQRDGLARPVAVFV
jgi:tRNA pseudouridine55 synthase